MSYEAKNIATHAEFIILLVTLLGGFYLLDGKIERQGERTDKLYEMWCVTQKEIYELRADNSKMFYELLNEERS